MTLPPVSLLALIPAAGTTLVILALPALARAWRQPRRPRPPLAFTRRRLVFAPLPARLLERLLTPPVLVPGATVRETRLIQAGYALGSPRVLVHGLLVTAALCALALVGLWALALPLALLPLPGALAGALGILLAQAELRAQTRQRADRLRVQLVSFLYNLAALVTAGALLEQALGELAGERNDLTRELAHALRLRGTNVPFEDALHHMHARCATKEVTRALHLIILARRRGEKNPASGAVAPIAPALRDLAESTRHEIAQRRRAQKEVGQLRSRALMVLFCLPAVVTILLYPALYPLLLPLVGR